MDSTCEGLICPMTNTNESHGTNDYLRHVGMHDAMSLARVAPANRQINTE